jgi:hypothetical protein
MYLCTSYEVSYHGKDCLVVDATKNSAPFQIESKTLLSRHFVKTSLNALQPTLNTSDL